MVTLRHNFISFSNREQRQNFALKEYSEIFNASEAILDVGCDNNLLKLALGDRVFGIDISGSPDLRVNLETDALKMFEDKKYDLVICFDVLEHLDNLHQVYDDLFRVSKKYVLISLPNCLNLRKIIKILRKGECGKFYGLPISKPDDRHKWFFSYKDIINFVKARKSDYWVIEDILLHYNVMYPRSSFKGLIKQIIFKQFIKLFKLNSMSKDVFILFKNKS